VARPLPGSLRLPSYGVGEVMALDVIEAGAKRVVQRADAAIRQGEPSLGS